jgi:hypothetical protein
VEAQEEPRNINWLELRATFCDIMFPKELIKLKQKEFQDLK